MFGVRAYNFFSLRERVGVRAYNSFSQRERVGVRVKWNIRKN
jgi:hypothetical protein